MMLIAGMREIVLMRLAEFAEAYDTAEYLGLFPASGSRDDQIAIGHRAFPLQAALARFDSEFAGIDTDDQGVPRPELAGVISAARAELAAKLRAPIDFARAQNAAAAIATAKNHFSRAARIRVNVDREWMAFVFTTANSSTAGAFPLPDAGLPPGWSRPDLDSAVDLHAIQSLRQAESTVRDKQQAVASSILELANTIRKKRSQLTAAADQEAGEAAVTIGFWKDARELYADAYADGTAKLAEYGKTLPEIESGTVLSFGWGDVHAVVTETATKFPFGIPSAFVLTPPAESVCTEQSHAARIKFVERAVVVHRQATPHPAKPGKLGEYQLPGRIVRAKPILHLRSFGLAVMFALRDGHGSAYHYVMTADTLDFLFNSAVSPRSMMARRYLAIGLPGAVCDPTGCLQEFGPSIPPPHLASVSDQLEDEIRMMIAQAADCGLIVWIEMPLP
jgi:hypothetical protein